MFSCFSIPINLYYTTLLAFVMVLVGISGFGQETKKISKQGSFLGYPGAFYTPETRWGAGAIGTYTFSLKKGDTLTPPAQVQLGIAFTQNHQFQLAVPFQLFFKDRKHSLIGEVDYNNFYYYSYGVGNENKAGIRSRYNVTFPIARLNYLYRIKPRFYTGLRWWYENWQIPDTSLDISPNEKVIPGFYNAITSGLGLVFLYDSRDNLYYSRSGNYLELVAHDFDHRWGSAFNYRRYRMDARHFEPIGNHQSMAFQAFGDFTTGIVPFSQLPLIGGVKRMRGYIEGRYRDNNLLMVQAEYRNMVFKRWGFALFAQCAVVSDRVDNFQSKNIRPAAGAGIRFLYDQKRKITLRLDGAIGQNSTGAYFTIGEAF